MSMLNATYENTPHHLSGRSLSEKERDCKELLERVRKKGRCQKKAAAGDTAGAIEVGPGQGFRADPSAE